jgi:hypothetical protein
VPNCTRCGLEVHWVSGLGVTPAVGRTGSPPRMGSQLSSRGTRPAPGSRPPMIACRAAESSAGGPDAGPTGPPTRTRLLAWSRRAGSATSY